MAKFETLRVCGIPEAIIGMRNPLKSYDISDSYYEPIDLKTRPGFSHFIIGSNDYRLAKSLWKGGTEHRKYLRMIQVWVDIWAPRFWWSEFDTYKIGTAANSESTMHKLLSEDFNYYEDFEWPYFEGEDRDIEAAFKDYVDLLKTIRDRANKDKQNKEHYHQILKAMLPESFIQKRTVNLNYETLATMYRQRKNHRLPQWNTDFVSWVKTLPYSEFITGDFNENEIGQNE